jgi:S1-C subfamily serine protease
VQKLVASPAYPKALAIPGFERAIVEHSMPIAEPSVKSLFLQMLCNRQPLATGTGFVVQARSGPVLITNYHNLSGRHPQTGQPLHPSAAIPDEVIIIHNQLNQLGTWVQRTEPLYHPNGRQRWVEHAIHAAAVDCVALPLTQTNDVQFYPYNLANPGPALRVGPADVVSVVGFPFGLTGGGSLALWATGFVASEPEVDFNNLPLMLIDCRSRQGQSGSPVIAYRGGGAVAMADGGTAVFNGPVLKLLGIYSGRISEQSDLGFVWKVAAIEQIVGAVP